MLTWINHIDFISDTVYATTFITLADGDFVSRTCYNVRRVILLDLYLRITYPWAERR